MAEAQGASGAPAPRTLHIDLQTRLGRITGNLPVPAGTIRLSELAWMAMPLLERMVDMSVKDDEKQGRQVSCKKGCGACCRQAVPVSPPEAWMLADLVASMPAPRRQMILERFQQATQKLAGAGFGDRSLDTGSTNEEFMALGLDYFRLGIPCPFLEDESCSIHPWRPSACREYLVSSPAENCARVGDLPVQGVPMVNRMTAPLAQVAALFLDGEPQHMPLTLALEWALEHQEEGRRRFDAVELMTTLLQLMFPEAEGEAAEDSRPG